MINGIKERTVKNKHMAQQTAMQMMIEWSISLKDNEQQCTDWIVIKNKAIELLQMEKEQSKFFFECGRNFQLTGEGTFSQVYNETYGKDSNDSNA